ncbi:ABC transporter ATP-binding protein [Chelativorans composti]|jgi:ABC-type proline/glycine betaine transport systems, ATPase components|uniref:ABC transporter ATP-binding protein n=1 Tax=Chelativorans composti TaxID=768533 RepID=A0ABW5DC29_9HYPH
MIEIEELTKVYDGNTVVDRVSLTVPEGTVAAIVGTSGSGKTTLLRMINRLVEPTSGSVRIGGQDTRAIPPHELRRQIGYVIQGYGLFPHRTVAENIATVPQLLGWDRDRIARRVDELMEIFQLDPAQYRDRFPSELSGGQQQRVGVARALAAEPKILLMDEPFGALDPIIRTKARDDLMEIQKKFRTTIIIVTHDMDEAIQLGDRIAVMQEGRVLQWDTPTGILLDPAHDFVAELVGVRDRPFRLLSLQPVRDAVEEGDASGPPVTEDTSLRDAFAEMLWSGRRALPVVSRANKRLGRLTLEGISRRAARLQ